MTKESLMELGLSEEQTKQVLGMLDGNFVTKARFDDVNGQNKQLKQTLSERDKQLEGLKSVDAQALTAEIERLREENEKAKIAFESELKAQRVNASVESALLKAQAKNPATVRPLLEQFLKDAEIDENGVVKGLSEKVKALAEDESTSFLFQTQTSKTSVSGFTPAEKKDGTPQKSAPTTLAEAIKNTLENKQ